MKTIVLIALEASGDLLGSKLIDALHRQGDFTLYGVAGPKMREKAITSWKNTEDFQAIGPIQVIKKLPKILSLIHFIKKQLLQSPPDAIIFLDSPSFSLKVARKLKKKGLTSLMVQVVAPSVWAWGKEKRIQQVKESIDLLFPLFAFEEPLFPIETHWCGHPLFTKEFTAPKVDKNPTPLLALFPGSRPGEVQKNLELMLSTSSKVQSFIPNLSIGIALSHTISQPLKDWIRKKCDDFQLQQVFFVEGETRYELMERSWAALAKCGTVTLELFLKQVPTIVCYKINYFEHFWAKYVLKVHTPFFALPNILAGRCAVQECIIEEPKASHLASALLPLVQDKPKGVDPSAFKIVQEQLFSSPCPEDDIVQHICKRLS